MKRWLIGMFTSTVLLAAVVFPIWVRAQVTGSGGVAADPAAAAKTVSR